VENPITVGHLLMLMGLVFAAGAAALALTTLRYRGAEHGRGTPGYARVRSDRRKALYALALAIILFAAGCFTPLAERAIG
jgi:hypothetical protein